VQNTYHNKLEDSDIHSRCNDFVRYEGATHMTGVLIAELIMLLRIENMYTKHRWVTTFLGLLWLVQLGVNSWQVFYGEGMSLSLPPIV
jgi:hypothetical protein